MRYSKPWLSIEEQVDFLMGKGMICDRDVLAKRLREVGYYRLSAYWFPFKVPAEGGRTAFREGTEFSHVWRTYQFDRDLRLVMFDAVSRVEVFVRSQIAHLASRQTGIFGYPPEEAAHLRREYRLARRSEPFMKHFDAAYGDSHELPPYWMMVEAIPMGSLESLYSHLAPSVRSEIAGLFGVRVPVFKSWLSVIRVARNACCHHSRVWNRVWGVRPMIPKEWADFGADAGRTFAVLTVLNYMLGKIDAENGWKAKVEALLSDYEDIPGGEVGFPEDWKSLGAWGGQHLG